MSEVGVTSLAAEVDIVGAANWRWSRWVRLDLEMPVSAPLEPNRCKCQGAREARNEKGPRLSSLLPLSTLLAPVRSFLQLYLGLLVVPGSVHDLPASLVTVVHVALAVVTKTPRNNMHVLSYIPTGLLTLFFAWYLLPLTNATCEFRFY